MELKEKLMRILERPDITDDVREQISECYREAERELKKWEMFFAHSGWGIVLGNVEHRVLDVMNPAFAAMHGYSVEELVGKPIISVFAPEEHMKLVEHIKNAHAQGNYVFESMHLRKDGTIFPTLSNITVVYDQDDKPLYRIVNVQDISVQKKMEKNTREEHRFNRLMLDSIPHIAFLIDKNTRKILVRNKAAEALNIPESFPCWYAISNGDYITADEKAEYERTGECRQGTRCHFCLAEESFSQGMVNREIFMAGKTYDTFWVPIDEEKQVFLHYFVDVSERKRHESELKSAVEAANAANEAKSRFLANMSHELRTPLNGIIGLAEVVLATADVTGEARENIGFIMRSGESLKGIIDSILDFSAIEAGKLDLVRKHFNLYAIVFDATSLLEVATRSKEMDLVMDYDSQMPQDYLGDDLKIKQILTNIVGNAVKFTKKGQVKITVRPGNMVDCKLECIIKVSDSGIGIPEEKIADIFQPFFQVHSGLTRDYGGTGLGLAITRGLAELMGGSIDVHSEFGKGSVFTIVIPLEPEYDKADIVVPKQIVAHYNAKVLVVEDDLISSRMLVRLLQGLGCEVDSAEDGQFAVDKCETGIGYDIIFMDRQMPKMDGLEATRRIRAKGVKTPIVAVTADAFEKDKEECFVAGMDGYVMKPVSRAVICEELARLFKPNG